LSDLRLPRTPQVDPEPSQRPLQSGPTTEAKLTVERLVVYSVEINPNPFFVLVDSGVHERRADLFWLFLSSRVSLRYGYCAAIDHILDPVDGSSPLGNQKRHEVRDFLGSRGTTDRDAAE
jgi:hypothetical protein